MRVMSQKEFKEKTKNATAQELHTMIGYAINEIINLSTKQLLELVKLEDEKEKQEYENIFRKVME